MKTTFKCEESKKLSLRNYSNFCRKDCKSDLLLNIGYGKNNYLESEKNFLETLNKHAPKKTKIFRGNHESHINKILSKALLNVLNLKIKQMKRKTLKIF